MHRHRRGCGPDPCRHSCRLQYGLNRVRGRAGHEKAVTPDDGPDTEDGLLRRQGGNRRWEGGAGNGDEGRCPHVVGGGD
eukprot:886799-Alexandrium_andersonii.AAC.1